MILSNIKGMLRFQFFWLTVGTSCLNIKSSPESRFNPNLLPYYNVSVGQTLTIEFPVPEPLTVDGLPPQSHFFTHSGVAHFSWTPTNSHMERTYPVTFMNSSNEKFRTFIHIAGIDHISRHTLIVYNSILESSRDVASYYADKRHIESPHLCGVDIPPGHYASPESALSARLQIRKCLCRLSEPTISPEECSGIGSDTLANQTLISTLVFVMGMPYRILNPTFTYTSDDDSSSTIVVDDDPSLDYALAATLLSEAEPFGDRNPADLSTLSSFQTQTDLESSQINAVRPSQDKMLAYGRIEGLDINRAKNLIDRTIQAESDGLHGTVIAEISDVALKYGQGVIDPIATWTRDAFLPYFGLSPESCFNYLGGLEDGSIPVWPWQTCRVGFSWGEIPGESASNLSKVTQASLFLGSNPGPESPTSYGSSPLVAVNTQASFDGFATMLNWRKTSAVCTPLCKDMTSTQAQAECRARSTDYFKEINTDCVGVEPGFLGTQVRSWTSQYYGIYPPNWEVKNVFGSVPGGSSGSGINGIVERTPPQLIEGDAFQNSQFVDTKYVRFGTRETSSFGAMAQLVPIYFVNPFTVSPPQSGNSLKLRLHYRNGIYFGGNVTIKFTAIVESQGVLTYLRSYSNSGAFPSTLPLGSSHATWTQFETPSMNLAGKTIRSAQIEVVSEGENSYQSYVEFDAFEMMIDGVSIPVPNGSFEKPYIGSVSSGQYVGDAIERLGAVAWFGSGSHFISGGWSFSRIDKFLSTFLGGRPLGEALLIQGSNAASSLVVGDPWYRPWGAKISIPNYNYRSDLWRETDLKPLVVSAFNGSSRMSAMRWSIDVCGGFDTSNCLQSTTESAWFEGTGGMSDSIVALVSPQTLRSRLAARGFTNHEMLLILKVWEVGLETQPLVSFARIDIGEQDSGYRPQIQLSGLSIGEDILSKNFIMPVRVFPGDKVEECEILNPAVHVQTQCTCSVGVCTLELKTTSPNFNGSDILTLRVLAGTTWSEATSLPITIMPQNDPLYFVSSIPDTNITAGTTISLPFSVNEGDPYETDQYIVPQLASIETLSPATLPASQVQVTFIHNEAAGQPSQEVASQVQISIPSGFYGRARITVRVWDSARPTYDGGTVDFLPRNWAQLDTFEIVVTTPPQ